MRQCWHHCRVFSYLAPIFPAYTQRLIHHALHIAFAETYCGPRHQCGRRGWLPFVPHTRDSVSSTAVAQAADQGIRPATSDHFCATSRCGCTRGRTLWPRGTAICRCGTQGAAATPRGTYCVARYGPHRSVPTPRRYALRVPMAILVAHERIVGTRAKRLGDRVPQHQCDVRSTIALVAALVRSDVRS